MDFLESMKDVGRRSKSAAKSALTEEATKTSVVLPFIRALGFDIFDLDEVVPEFVSDVGTKKGEKVDFALKIDGKIAMLLEAKPIGTSLGSSQFNQLFRYFSVTDARVAILTNGRDVWFFSDVDKPNTMDKIPFFTIDLQGFDDNQAAELEKFHRDNFDIENLIETASTLKFVDRAAAYLAEQLTDPDDEFVRLIGKRIYEGNMTKQVVEQLKPSVQSALDAVIRARIEDKLGVSLRSTVPANEVRKADDEGTVGVDAPQDDGIETTEEELQAFYVVRAIAAEDTEIERVTIRDARTYCSIFMDDNNRKPICRLYFNSKSVKYLGLMDDDKNETKHLIESVGDIYKYRTELKRAVARYA